MNQRSSRLFAASSSGRGGSQRLGLVSLGVGLAAAGVGAALGVAAERAAVGRPLLGRRGTGDEQQYGSLHGPARAVECEDGTLLHVEVDEPPDGDPAVTVVFCHGYALSLDSWHFQRQALREQAGQQVAGVPLRMVFWDQRGHGRSQPGPPGTTTIDQLGSDLRHVIAATAPTGPLVLVGHSMGGMTVMALAAADPQLVIERVLGVALVSTSAGGLGEVDLGLARLGRVVIRAAPSTVRALTRTPKLVEQTRRVGSDLEAVLVRRYSYASPVSPALVAFTAEMISGTRLQVISDFMAVLPRHDKKEALAVLDGREMLVLVGAEDLLLPARHSADIVGRLPGAEHVVVPRSGHLVMLEHPEVVNRHLLDLIERSVKHVGGGSS